MDLLPITSTINIEEVVILNEIRGGKFFSNVKLPRLVNRVVGEGYKTTNGRRAYFIISATKGYSIATVDLLSGTISLNHDEHKPYVTYKIANEEAILACQFYNLKDSSFSQIEIF